MLFSDCSMLLFENGKHPPMKQPSQGSPVHWEEFPPFIAPAAGTRRPSPVRFRKECTLRIGLGKITLANLPRI